VLGPALSFRAPSEVNCLSDSVSACCGAVTPARFSVFFTFGVKRWEAHRFTETKETVGHTFFQFRLVVGIAGVQSSLTNSIFDQFCIVFEMRANIFSDIFMNVINKFSTV